MVIERLLILIYYQSLIESRNICIETYKNVAQIKPQHLSDMRVAQRPAVVNDVHGFDIPVHLDAIDSWKVNRIFFIVDLYS
jgi:hypothetical protein